MGHLVQKQLAFALHPIRARLVSGIGLQVLDYVVEVQEAGVEERRAENDGVVFGLGAQAECVGANDLAGTHIAAGLFHDAFFQRVVDVHA